MQPLALAALVVISACTVQLYVLGRRFRRGHVERRGVVPRTTWMFHDSGDPELERSRRLALAILPVYLVALAVYLFRP